MFDNRNGGFAEVVDECKSSIYIEEIIIAEFLAMKLGEYVVGVSEEGGFLVWVLSIAKRFRWPVCGNCYLIISQSAAHEPAVDGSIIGTADSKCSFSLKSTLFKGCLSRLIFNYIQ